MSFMITGKETSFTFGDLGFLNGTPDRILSKCVNLAEQLLVNSAAVISIRDVDTQRASFHSIGQNAHMLAIAGRFPLAGSLTQQICLENDLISSIENHPMDWSPEMPEIKAFRAKGFVAAPIHGPAEEPIGMIACLTQTERDWNKEDFEALEDVATLVTQRILLKATLQTVKLMASETLSVASARPARSH